MNRRTFLAAVGAVAAAPATALTPAAPVNPAAGLAFHPNAFAMVIPMPRRYDVLYGVGTVPSDLDIEAAANRFGEALETLREPYARYAASIEENPLQKAT